MKTFVLFKEVADSGWHTGSKASVRFFHRETIEEVQRKILQEEGEWYEDVPIGNNWEMYADGADDVFLKLIEVPSVDTEYNLWGSTIRCSCGAIAVHEHTDGEPCCGREMCCPYANV